MNSIRHLNTYVERMEKSCLDKLFFIDKLYDPIHTILDFGCANGVLIKAMQLVLPECSYIGYDISREMLKRAKENVPDGIFHHDWDALSFDPDKTMINISSTVHEVYAYGDEQSVATFWKRVFGSGFRYIAIRDMMLSEALPDQVSDEDLARVRQLFPEKLAEFESIWGSISQRHNFVHYLLKYRYTENWDREVRENYLPLPMEALIRMIPEDYEIIYQEHYVLPFIRQHILDDSGIDLTDATHFKLLLRLNKRKR